MKKSPIRGTSMPQIPKLYILPKSEDTENVCQVDCVWKLDEKTFEAMYGFREAVVQNKKTIVVEMIKGFFDDHSHQPQIEELADLLTNRTSPEPSKTALMKSILFGSRPLVEFILQLFSDFPGEEFEPIRNSAVFPPHLTPLMLSCIEENFAIVECLILRGHYIPLPHHPTCMCAICANPMDRNIDLSKGIELVDTYRAISSRAFLWLGNSDPLLAACSLAEDLSAWEEADKTYKEIYRHIYNQVQDFAYEFIQQCRTSEEVKLLLNRKEGATLSTCQVSFPRLRLALDADLKQCLSHSNIQTVVADAWKGKWRSHSKTDVTRTIWRFTRHTFLYPFLAISHAFSGGRLISSLRNPRDRYLSYFASYITFLMLITVLRWVRVTKNDGVNTEVELTNPTVLILEVFVFAYILGLILAEFMEFSRRGFERYFVIWWRLFDFFMMFIFVMAFLCWIAKEVTSTLKLHRKHWPMFHPAILFDIFFGLACMLAYWRIFYFIQLHRKIGSTVISMGRCVTHALNYFIIIGVIMISFAIALNTMLQPYSDNIMYEPEYFPEIKNVIINKQGNKRKMIDYFDSFITSIRNLFWAFYGYLHPADYYIVVGNAGPEKLPTEHYITKGAAELTVAAYYLVTVVLVLNLMISLLVKSAHEVLDNEDVEWKYTRLHIYAEYFERSMAVPPPFNLIYVPVDFIWRCFTKEYRFIWPDLLIKKSSISEKNYKQQADEDITYMKLIRKLFIRYIQSSRTHFKSVQALDRGNAGGHSKEETRKIKTFFMNAHKLE
uniref:Transient receptor ion channel domain-containing protein n=1 Tax=Acrobeloides nanus TaxID=290746 RepID=A0A914BYQ0_9BILA